MVQAQGFAAQLGFRVPNMIISPFVRRHYVSHTPMDHTAILKFVEALDEVDVDGVEPLTSVIPMRLPMREDVVADGDIASLVLANAPLTEDGFFVVPKVIE